MMKSLPIGIEDFKEAQNYYYVDKTMFIEDIVSTMFGKAILITRPRRFGKSLMASMLDHFFNVKENSEALFADKKISASKPAMAHLNQYPVIHLNMKNVSGKTSNEIMDRCISEIARLYRDYDFLLNGDTMIEPEKEYFRHVLSSDLPGYADYQESVRRLSYFLLRHYQRKVVILVDEYDTPIESSYEVGAFEECMPFFKELYSNALKGNDSLLFAIMTGVLEISKESLFSGLNNIGVYSVIDNRFSSYFGFTEEETKQMLDYYGLSSSFDEASRWYGGYEFGESVLLNPWSILNFIERNQIRPYWVNTGSNNLLRELLAGHAKDELVLLVNDESRPVEFNSAVNYRDFAYDNNAIYSYLVQSGYLVAQYLGAPKSYLIKIPNLEIYEVFKNDIIARGFDKGLLHIAVRLRKAIEDNDVPTISSLLQEYILRSYSYFDLQDEKNYQVMLTGILAVLFDTHVVKAEVNGPRGRCDIMVSPKQKGGTGIVFEIKLHRGTNAFSKGKLAESANSAIRQIERKGYDLELKQRECKKILLYGIAFDISGAHSVASKEYK